MKKKFLLFGFLCVALLLQARSTIQLVGKHGQMLYAVVESAAVLVDESGTNITVCNLSADTYLIRFYENKHADTPMKTIELQLMDSERAILTVDYYFRVDTDIERIRQNDLPAPVGTPYFPSPVISDVDFQEILRTVRAESFDKDKLKTVKISCRYAYFTTEQVRQLLESFTFDGNEKLETAKMLFPSTVDKNNYYKLKEAFSFLKYRNAFLEFLESQPEEW